jgi:hypothetical protein
MQLQLALTTLSLFVCRPGSVSMRETRFSRDKHLGTEGVPSYLIESHSSPTQVTHLSNTSGGS